MLEDVTFSSSFKSSHPSLVYSIHMVNSTDNYKTDTKLVTVFTHWILTVGFNLINHTKQPHQSFLPAYMSCLSANQQKQRTKRLHVKNNRISHSNNSSFLLLFLFYFLRWRLREKKVTFELNYLGVPFAG